MPDDLPETAKGAAHVVDAATLHVDGVTNDVRLAAIEAPVARTLHGAARGFEDRAEEALTSLVEAHVVSVRAVLPADRDGRMQAHVVRDDGVWLQGDLVRRGLARVAVTPDTGEGADALLALEAEARAKKRGLWAEPAFAVRSADDLDQLDKDFGSYQLVEGVVASAARRGDVVYVDFGADYHTDFTATIPRSSLPLFAAAGVKPAQLAGRHVRVRGWITHYNGPTLEITHPAALELLK